jgi:murein DD-endopeptidase
VRRPPPLVLGPPLREGMWVAARGPSNASGHRRALIANEGKAYIAQRFAIDWMKVGLDRRVMPENHQSKNESWYGYGAEVIAVADAVVTAIKDGIPENVPLSEKMAVPITSETVGGNYVVLNLGGGRYAFYGHLQPKSLRVKRDRRYAKDSCLDSWATQEIQMRRICIFTSPMAFPRSERKACHLCLNLSRCLAQ